MKSSILTINPAITENMECSIVRVHALLVGLLLDHGVSLHFVSLPALQTCWGQHSKQRIA